MNKILVIQTRIGIGDQCIFLPCIHQIAKKNKSYEMHLLTKKRSCAKDFLKDYKFIEKIFYLPDERGLKLNFSIIKLLRQNKYQKCFIMHYGIRYYLLSLLANIKKIFFYGLIKKKENIVERSQKSTKKWLNDKNLNFNPIIFDEKIIRKKNQITLGIGGSGLSKKWDIEKYIQLAKLINTKKKIEILLAGGPEEISDSKYIKKKLSNLKISAISLCEKKIVECVDPLSQSIMYIGNDTGFMHLSGVFGVKTFGLFGDTPINYSSYNRNIIPILPEGYKKISHGSNAMDKILVKHVYKQIKKFI